MVAAEQVVVRRIELAGRKLAGVDCKLRLQVEVQHNSAVVASRKRDLAGVLAAEDRTHGLEVHSWLLEDGAQI